MRLHWIFLFLYKIFYTIDFANGVLAELLHCYLEIRRTPHMSAIHHDTSPDLRVVGKKLKDILEVLYPVHTVGKQLVLCWHFITCFQAPFFFYQR